MPVLNSDDDRIIIQQPFSLNVGPTQYKYIYIDDREGKSTSQGASNDHHWIQAQGRPGPAEAIKETKQRGWRKECQR